MKSRTRRVGGGLRSGLATIALVWAGTAATRQAAAQTGPGAVGVGGACENERYEALLQAGLAALNEEQYRYFLALDEACRMHKRDIAATVAGSPDAANPCIHEPYKRLAAKEPANMMGREYAYFREVDRECTAYTQANRATADSDPPLGPSWRRRFLTSVAVVGSIVATLVASLN